MMVMNSLVLLLFGVSSIATAVDPFFENLLNMDDRRLQKAACGETLGIVSAEKIAIAGRLYIESLLTPELQAQDILDATVGVLFQTAVSDCRVVKLCGSCESVVRLFFEESRRFPNYHFQYCGANDYGWGALHSSLVLMPLDPLTGELPDIVNLRTMINLKETRLNLDSAPTEANLVQTMAALTNATNPNTVLNFFADYLVGMLHASSGSVVVFPDGPGYGENAPTQNRTTFSPKAYQQSAVVSFLTMEYYLKYLTDFCTLADRTVTIYGAGDGGAAAPFVGDVFRRFGYRILKVFSASPILDLETFLMDAIASYDAGESSRRLNEMVLLAAYTYSANTPGLNNTGSTPLLSASYQDILVSAMSAPVPGRYEDIIGLLPTDVAKIFNPSILQLFREAGGSRPCSTGSEQELCQEILEASAWRVLEGDVARLIFEIELCYSEDDTLLSANQFPSKIFESTVNAQLLVTTFQGPKGLPGLAPVGGHTQSLGLCSVSPMLFLALDGHRPDVLKDRGNYQAPFTDDQLDFCAEGQKTVSPAAVPTLSPDTFGGDGTGDGTPSLSSFTGSEGLPTEGDPIDGSPTGGEASGVKGRQMPFSALVRFAVAFLVLL
jgi:hypothetical protein